MGHTPTPSRFGATFTAGGGGGWVLGGVGGHPCILGDPQREGDKIRIGGAHKWAEMPSGRKCYITPAFSGIPKDKGDKIGIGEAHKWAEMLHHPCILGYAQREGQNQNRWGPQVGGNATSPRGTKSELDA